MSNTDCHPKVRAGHIGRNTRKDLRTGELADFFIIGLITFS